MQRLKSGSVLQGGRYKIEMVLGQGGFGITYLATQQLLNRKVAIKEFFYKDYCERDEATNYVTLGTNSNRELVERFMEKFIKEARTISTLNHSYIIRIYDIFKENNTAYYVMEYIEGMSLAEIVKQQGALLEDVAVGYIKQVASALNFVHQHSINHLDVKPANIMVRREDNQAVLIDFGLSKQYDASGEQTSTTPVGISHGYAPMEQYNVGGVGTFSPQTDIYSLGATLYKLVTGNTPPQAIEIFNDGLPELPSKVSSHIKEVIKRSMQPKKAERYFNIKEFVLQLDIKEEAELCEQEETIVIQEVRNSKQVESVSLINRGKKTSKYSVALIGVVVLLLGVIGFVVFGTNRNESLFVTDSEIVKIEVEEEKVNNSTEKVRLLDEQRKKDSIVVVRKEEAEKQEKESIDALNEKAPLASLRKNETEMNKMTHRAINGHEWVDLGLSVKWATCNVGASSPNAIGDYFAWGEIMTKNEYSKENSHTSKMVLNDISGDVEYDVARALWGGKWRLPTKQELEELKHKCIWDKVKDNYGMNGYKVIGPNGNSIFLPASGYKEGNSIISEIGYVGNYWSSTPYDNNKYFSTYYLEFSINPIDYSIECTSRRYVGRSIRPVID